ncbi:hypothetical protein OROHE_026440 [Orobanche hederae]
MEGEKRHGTLNLANGKSVQVVERDCGDYVEITPKGTILDLDGFSMVQGEKHPNYVHLSFPAVVYKIPKNLPELDMAERKKVITQIRAGNPCLVVDQDALMKILEEMKMKLNLDEDKVEKLCEEIKMKLKM